MQNEQNILGFELRRLRMAHGLSLREVARRARISPPFLSDIELGRRKPSEFVLNNLTVAIGADASGIYILWIDMKIWELESRIKDLRSQKRDWSQSVRPARKGKK